MWLARHVFLLPRPLPEQKLWGTTHMANTASAAHSPSSLQICWCDGRKRLQLHTTEPRHRAHCSLRFISRGDRISCIWVGPMGAAAGARRRLVQDLHWREESRSGVCNGVAKQAGSASPATLMTPQNSQSSRVLHLGVQSKVKGERRNWTTRILTALLPKGFGDLCLHIHDGSSP